RVTKNRYSYVWKPKGTKFSVTLASVKGTSMSKRWEAYDKAVSRRQDIMTFSKLWHIFLNSVAFSELSVRTQTHYCQHQKKLLAVIVQVKADNIKTEQFRIYMDKRGLQSKTQANHELASMSRVYNWGFERGYVKGNPCKGVRKFTVKARDVYKTDEEYYAIYEAAIPAIKVAMEIA